jgi:hypothetical protein
VQTYTLGDTIRLEIKLRDKTGIGAVAAVFNACTTRRRPTGRTITLTGNGEGRTEASIELTAEITNHTVPGEYNCEHIEVRDTLGNYLLHYPDISFRIEGVPGDHEGPELIDWRFKTE